MINVLIGSMLTATILTSALPGGNVDYSVITMESIKSIETNANEPEVPETIWTDEYDYPSVLMVTEINPYTKCETWYDGSYHEQEMYEVIGITKTGELYAFLADDGDWNEGDLAAVTMGTCGTLSIEDDIVLDARYVGYVSAYEYDNWVNYAQ